MLPYTSSFANTLFTDLNKGTLGSGIVNPIGSGIVNPIGSGNLNPRILSYSGNPVLLGSSPINPGILNSSEDMGNLY